MQFHRIIHRILLMIGIALGIVTTGVTANAKAQQVNTNNTQNNNPSNQSISHNQFSSNASKFVDQLESSPVINEFNSESISTSSSEANIKSNYSYASSSNAGQVSSSASESNLSLLQQLNKSSNYSNNHNLSPKSSVHTDLNHVYHNVLPNSGVKLRQNSHSIKNNFNLNHSGHVIYHQNIHSWFKDGLNSQNLKARNWVSWHESNHRWRILSYGGVCVGYFQLSPRYLGYRNGHVDLRPEHQVKIADQYVQKRYGTWVNAKRFWIYHHWY